MLFAVDVGNTHTVLGLYDGEHLQASWRIATCRETTADELAISIANLFSLRNLSVSVIDAAIVASVVPQITSALVELMNTISTADCMVVGPETDTGMAIRYDNPQEVGADRIVNAVAGFALYGGQLIIVDFGTATTFDAISREGDYLGGAIAPGIEVSSEALFRRAARLSKVDLLRPPSAIGKNTRASIQAGVILGTGGMVDRIIDCFEMEMGKVDTVVATGGLAGLIAPECKRITTVDSDLTLTGLRLIYERNL